MIRSLGFTVMLTLLTTVLCMIMTMIAAYPLTKKLKGRKIFMFIIIVTMFFSGALSRNTFSKDLNLLDTIWALVLPGLISPFYLIILISFFNGIPESLEEAAEIDGTSQIGTMLRIILPLSLPVIATLSLFYAVGRWNGFQDTLLYITSEELYPLQLKLYQLVQNNMITDLTRNEGPAAGVRATTESLKAASAYLPRCRF